MRKPQPGSSAARFGFLFIEPTVQLCCGARRDVVTEYDLTHDPQVLSRIKPIMEARVSFQTEGELAVSRGGGSLGQTETQNLFAAPVPHSLIPRLGHYGLLQRRLFRVLVDPACRSISWLVVGIACWG